MKLSIPGTDMQIESRKIEEVTVSGPSLNECLQYCMKHSLKQVGTISTESYTRPDGTIGVLFAVRAIRELTLVEA